MSGDRQAPKRVLVRAALSLLLLVAAPTLYVTKGFGAPDNSRPLSLNLPSDGRWVESAPFHASPPGSYSASLTLSRKYPHREMECLADVGMPYPTSTESGRRTDCPQAFFPAQLEWKLLEEGRPARATYDYDRHAGEYTSATVGRILGSFELHPQTSYAVRARLSGAPKQLWLTNPKLEVAYNDIEGLIVAALFFSLLSGALGLTGLVVLGSTLWTFVRATRRRPESTKTEH